MASTLSITAYPGRPWSFRIPRGSSTAVHPRPGFGLLGPLKVSFGAPARTKPISPCSADPPDPFDAVERVGPLCLSEV